MARKQKGNIEDLDLTQPKTAQPAGGFNPDIGRTNEANKPFIAHTSLYLRREVHRKVRTILFEEGGDFSDLVEGLLEEWLRKRGA